MRALPSNWETDSPSCPATTAELCIGTATRPRPDPASTPPLPPCSFPIFLWSRLQCLLIPCNIYLLRKATEKGFYSGKQSTWPSNGFTIKSLRTHWILSDMTKAAVCFLLYCSITNFCCYHKPWVQRGAPLAVYRNFKLIAAEEENGEIFYFFESTSR